jgi:hypothetical protein
MSESLQEPSVSTRAVSVPEWARGRKQPRDPKTGRLWPRKCELYVSGHTVHYIQGNRSASAESRRGKLVTVDGNEITVNLDGEILHYHRHRRDGEHRRVFQSVEECWRVLLLDRRG